jgi:hypothetical protein
MKIENIPDKIILTEMFIRVNFSLQCEEFFLDRKWSV